MINIVDIFTCALMVEILVLGATLIDLVEAKARKTKAEAKRLEDSSLQVLKMGE